MMISHFRDSKSELLIRQKMYQLLVDPHQLLVDPHQLMVDPFCETLCDVNADALDVLLNMRAYFLSTKGIIKSHGHCVFHSFS